MTSAGFTRLASYLSDEYTVVTYDPRGFRRSTIDPSVPGDHPCRTGVRAGERT
jgi:pimeloyl-ACP methyl ester carboxylesterase